MIEAVADRLDGAPRQLRRRWSDEFKAQIVVEALEPGASVSAIARRIGIHPSQLFAWRRDAPRGSLQIPPGVVSQIPPPARQDKGLLV
ncbi:transposase [Bradyrhizobium diazoefficiens]|uniref:transposase n=1 Tax=Bradyrhizobium diazoefficiens TaxID=1355477 RepID=UPI00359BB802